jgi:hypothetical protein
VRQFKLILVSALMVSVLTGCSLFYPNLGNNESPSDPMNPSPSSSQEIEDSSSPEPEESETPTASKMQAKPTLIYSGVDADAKTLMLVGEVSNFAEDGGECILTFYSGNTALIQERVPAEHNVSTTQCFPLTIGLSRLPKGVGHVTVGYESEKYEGLSEIFEVIIP